MEVINGLKRYGMINLISLPTLSVLVMVFSIE